MAKKKQSESVPTSSGRVLRQRKSTTGGEKVDGKDKGKMPVEVKEKAKVSGNSLRNSVMILAILVALTAVASVGSPTITSHTALTSSALTSTAAFASQTITSPTASTSCSPSTHVVAVSPSAPTYGYCSYQILGMAATPFPDDLPIWVGALIIIAFFLGGGRKPPPDVRVPRGPATVRFPKNKKPFPKLQMTKK